MGSQFEFEPGEMNFEPFQYTLDSPVCVFRLPTLHFEPFVRRSVSLKYTFAQGQGVYEPVYPDLLLLGLGFLEIQVDRVEHRADAPFVVGLGGGAVHHQGDRQAGLGVGEGGRGAVAAVAEGAG